MSDFRRKTFPSTTSVMNRLKKSETNASISSSRHSAGAARAQDRSLRANSQNTGSGPSHRSSRAGDQ